MFSILYERKPWKIVSRWETQQRPIHTCETLSDNMINPSCVFVVIFDHHVRNTWYWKINLSKVIREVRAQQGRPNLTVVQDKCHNFGHKSAYWGNRISRGCFHTNGNRRCYVGDKNTWVDMTMVYSSRYRISMGLSNQFSMSFRKAWKSAPSFTNGAISSTSGHSAF